MAKSNDFSCTLMGEVVITAAKAGWEPQDFGTIAKNENLMRQFLKVVRGTGEVKVSRHLIDLDADPCIPYDGWKVEEHKKGGQFAWDPTKVNLFLSEKQKAGTIEGNKLRKELADQPVYNANLLDYLLDNPHLIPEEWKGKAVFFWGTIYRNSGDNLCVRYLIWDGGHWRQGSSWLDNFDADRPSAVAAS